MRDGAYKMRGLCLAALMAAAALGGCNPFSAYEPTRAQIIADRIAPANVAELPGTIYCYRTLARVDCRKHPEPGQEDRLMSQDGGNFAGPSGD